MAEETFRTLRDSLLEGEPEEVKLGPEDYCVTTVSPHIAKLLDPTQRDRVIEGYRSANMGGERYGVVCPKCYKRICPQGLWPARINVEQYCQCKEQYEEEVHERIDDILATHGLPHRNLKTKVNMKEATVKKTKKGKKLASRTKRPATGNSSETITTES